MTRTIDTNLWLGHWPTRGAGSDPAGLVSMMDRNQVKTGLVSSLDGIFHKDPEGANTKLARAVDGFSRRLLPVPVVNPRVPYFRPLPKGLMRVVPPSHRFSPRSRRFIRLLEAASEAGVTVLISLRMRDERLERPLLKPLHASASQLASTISKFPSLKVVVNNARSNEANLILSRTDNSLVGCEWSFPIGFVEEMADKFGPERLVFGSNFPLHYYQCSLLQVTEADIPASWKRMILYENIQRIAEI